MLKKTLFLMALPLTLLSGCFWAPKTPVQHLEYYRQAAQQQAALERAAYASRLQDQLVSEQKIMLEIERERTKQAAIMATAAPQEKGPVEPPLEYKYLENILSTCLDEAKNCEDCGDTGIDPCEEIARELSDLKKRAGVVSKKKESPSTGGTVVNLIGSTVNGSSLLSTASTIGGQKSAVGQPPGRPKNQRLVMPHITPPETTGQTVAKTIGGVANNLIDKTAGIIDRHGGAAIVGAALVKATEKPTTEIQGSYTGGDNNAGRSDHNTKISTHLAAE